MMINRPSLLLQGGCMGGGGGGEFGIYVRQTTIFKGGIRLFFNLFLSPYYYPIFYYIHIKATVDYN